MIKVMLVDDQAMLRAGLHTIINAHAELEVVAEAESGLAALELLETLEVDVVLMDLRMPGLDGVETTKRIRTKWSPDQVRVLVLTTFDQDENVLKAMRAGADGFLSKGAGPTELADAIIDVSLGRHALSPTAIDALVEHAVESPVAETDPEVVKLFSFLTPRETEVVQLIIDGLDNKEIGERIFVSPFTVKTHANRAMMKVGARDRAQLVSLAIQAGLHLK